MKHVTPKQAAALTIGDIVTRYPYNGTPQEFFDKERTNLIEIYEVRSVNKSTQIVELVTGGSDSLMIAMPGEVNRIFIHQQNLAAQQLWWMNEKGS